MTLSPEAKQIWRNFHDRTAKEANRISEELTAAWSKFRDTALRFALILHLVECPDGPVSLNTMERALVLTEWFKKETRRVYAILADAPRRQAERTEDEALLTWMARRSWVTQRDIERGVRCLRGAGRATAVLRRLVKSGRLDEEYRRSGPAGGPSTFVFRVAESSPPACSTPATQPPPADTQSEPAPAAKPSEEEPWTKL